MNGESSYRRFIKGDNAALAELVEKYNKSLVFYLGGILGSVSVAEDAAADAFVSILVKKPRLKDDSAFRAYLFRTGRNRALDILRAQNRHGEIALEGTDAVDKATLEDIILKDERNRVLHAAIGGLKAEYREVLILLYFNDMSYKEAGVAMSKSEKQITNLAYRAKAALKAALEEKGYKYYEN